MHTLAYRPLSRHHYRHSHTTTVATTTTVTVATADQTKERLDAFMETFHSMAHDSINGYAYAYDSMLLPYFPYFSKCYGFDRYIPIWMVFESDQCALPDHDPNGVAYPHKVG